MEPDPTLGVPGITDARQLGRGGFGTVFEAQEPEFGRTVAVKVLRSALDDDAAERAFVRECRAMGSLSGHPHIVTVHRGGTTAGGLPYIVMDLMSGGSLADRIDPRHGGEPMPWREVLEVGVQLAGALETAHRRGVLHLDVKPANVMVSRYFEVKLGDFGISRLAGSPETSLNGVRASPAFSAPERLGSGAVSAAVDLYGLGATLFTLVAGTPAFLRDEPDQLLVLLARIAREPVPDLRPRGVPDVVCRVLEKLMAKDPADRYATAADAARALQDAQRALGQPVTRAVIEGDPSATEEASARTNIALDVAAATRPAPPPVPPHAVTVDGTSANGGPYGAPAHGLPHGSGYGGAAGAGTSWPAAQPTLGGSGWGPPSAPGPWPPQHPAGRPNPVGTLPEPVERGARRTGFVLGVVAVLVVAVALVAGGTWFLLRPTGGDTAAPPTVTSAPQPTVAPTTAPAPPQAVALAAGVDHPRAEEARGRLDAYVSAINSGSYQLAYGMLAPDSAGAQLGFEAWAEGQSTTVISDAAVTSVADAQQGVEAVMTFRSEQSAEFGFEGQTCTDWELAYTLEDPQLLIGAATPVSPPQEC